jgi:predicted glycosyltransferase
MKILHYTQHVLGIGHLFRSLAIDAALAPDLVHLVTGGPEVALRLPTNVRHHAMPALHMDVKFQELFSDSGTTDLEDLWQERKRFLKKLLLELQPEVLLIEMFPFGRKQFARELLPLLDTNRQQTRPALTLCSVRDILVEKENQQHFEKKVLGWLNLYFDGALIHSDPDLIPLEMTFDRVNDINCPLWYTGYVAEGSHLANRQEARQILGLDESATIILASAGSGTVGHELLAATLEASILLTTELPHQLLMFTGPHADSSNRNQLVCRARGYSHIRIETFTDRFPDHVLASDLSISMAGYNTTMNLLACKSHGLLLPFDQNREQRMRLQALADAGYLEMLNPVDLEPTRMVKIIRKTLSLPPAPGRNLRLHGDLESATIIRNLIKQRDAA